jgi:beta-glucanase (GH16 family)
MKFKIILFLISCTFVSLAQKNSNFNYLVWQDEFDVDGAIDTSKWFHQTKLPNGDSWYNGEIQHYTNRTDNSNVEFGVLKIRAKKETYTNQGHTKQYTSARLNSRFAFKYGRIEIKAKLPSGVGTWPAIWMLGKNIDEDGAYWDNLGFGTTPWPACGEIDIMEHWGINQNYVQSAMHTPSSHGNTINKGGQTIPTASTQFHVYALEWTEEKMVFSVDDVVHYTYNPPVKDAATWPFDSEQYLLLNLAILPDIDPNITVADLEIDYVRIYQEKPSSMENMAQNISLQAYPNPFVNQIIIEVNNISNENIPVNIFSIDGKLIKTQTVSIQNNKIILNDLDNLNKGVYLIQLVMENQVYHIRAIKNKSI